MKSYSSVLSKTFCAALSQRKIQSAVKSAAEKEDRSRNIVIFGVREEAEEILHDKTLEILQDVGERPMIRECCRIGQKRGDKPRPVKLCPSNSDIAHQVISKARLLRKKKDNDSMYICPDRTVEERKAYRKLL